MPNRPATHAELIEAIKATIPGVHFTCAAEATCYTRGRMEIEWWICVCDDGETWHSGDHVPTDGATLEAVWLAFVAKFGERQPTELCALDCGAAT